VWLRRVALALFLEVHEIYPWRLTDYTIDELVALLGLHIAQEKAGAKHIIDPDNYGHDFTACENAGQYIFYGELWCSNPLTMKEFAESLFAGIGFDSPGDAIQAVFRMVRYLTLKFVHHFGSDDDEQWANAPQHVGCGGLPLYNPPWFFAIKQTRNDRQVVALVREAMRSCNIPTVNGQGYNGDTGKKVLFGEKIWYAAIEPGIAFPSVGQILAHGDRVYSNFTRFPPNVVLMPFEDYLSWHNEFTSGTSTHRLKC